MALRFPRSLVLPSLCSLFLAFILNGCGSSKEEAPKTCEESQPTVAKASFSDLYTTVFSPQCGACHGPGTNSGTLGGPDLRTEDGFYNSLVGKKGTDYPQWSTLQKNRESCLAFDFIKANAADESLVVAVLDAATQLSGCEIKFHREVPQNICITTPNLAKLKEWINAGALR